MTPISIATTDDLNALSASINERLTQMANANQQDIDALTTQVTQVSTDLSAAQTKLQAEIDTLAGQGVNVTALQAAVQPLDAAVNALGDLQPTAGTATP